MREDVPYPMASLLSVFHLLQSYGIVCLLHVGESLEIERIIGRKENRLFLLDILEGKQTCADICKR